MSYNRSIISTHRNTNNLSVIQDFYREDKIHLSRNGTYQFSRNLKDVITETLKNGEKVVPERNRGDHESTGMPRKLQQNNGQYKYRAQGSRQHADNCWRKPGQYEGRAQGSMQLDNYGWGKPGQYEYRALGSRQHDDYGWGKPKYCEREQESGRWAH